MNPEIHRIYRGWDWCPNVSHHPTKKGIYYPTNIWRGYTIQQIFEGDILSNKYLKGIYYPTNIWFGDVKQIPNYWDINPNPWSFGPSSRTHSSGDFQRPLRPAVEGCYWRLKYLDQLELGCVVGYRCSMEFNQPKNKISALKTKCCLCVSSMDLIFVQETWFYQPKWIEHVI